MKSGPLYGVTLALVGTLILTPDALLMRLSGMDGFQMTGWRGVCMGTVMVLVWALTSAHRQRDLRILISAPGVLIVFAQVFNSLLFCLGIAVAPVAVVLLGVAAVPVFSAVLGQLVTGEAAGRATWIAIAAVLIGIGIAVFGDAARALSQDWRLLAGAAFGLGTALALSLNFVTVRARPQLPILLAIGCGACLAGALGWSVSGTDAMLEGRIWPMALTGLVVLPSSFFMLSLAARHTLAANVSLLILLETALGPLWVWVVLSEQPTFAMLVGAAIVLSSLTLYLLWMRRTSRL